MGSSIQVDLSSPGEAEKPTLWEIILGFTMPEKQNMLKYPLHAYPPLKGTFLEEEESKGELPTLRIGHKGRENCTLKRRSCIESVTTWICFLFCFWFLLFEGVGLQCIHGRTYG